MKSIRRFFEQAWLYQKAITAQFSLLEFATWDIVTQLLTMFFYIIVASFSFGKIDLTRWVVGNAFIICTTKCIFSLSMTFLNERYNGRLRSIIVSPTNELAVVFQNAFFSIAWGFATVAVGFTVGSLVFGVDFSNFNMSLFVIAILAATFACAGFGLFISAFGLLSDSIHLLNNTAVYAVMLLSGANFPLSQLPVPIQWLANIFPLNHGIAAANMCFEAKISDGYWKLIFSEIVIGAVYYVITFAMLKIVTKRAIKNAVLDVF